VTITNEHAGLLSQVQQTMFNASANRQGRTKRIKQHKTSVTAKFVADKMKDAGDKLIGKKYDIKDYHKEMLSISGVHAKELSSLNQVIHGPADVIESTMSEEGAKYQYWSFKWRADKVEMEYEKALERELKKAPSEGFTLLHPLNVNSTKQYVSQLSKYYDPVLDKHYDEVDWVKNADGFIPELKTTIEVKSTSSNNAKQNKGLNTADLRNYDGTVGYAKIVVNDTRWFPNMGMQEQEVKKISKNMAEVMDFWGRKSSRELRINATKWEEVMKGFGRNLVYSFTVEAVFTTFYSIEQISNVIRGKLQKLGLEAGKPLPEGFLEDITAPTNIVSVIISYLNNAAPDKDFNGILLIENLRNAVTSNTLGNKVREIARNTNINSAQELLDAVLKYYLEDDEWVDLFKAVARNTGKIFYSPSIQMDEEYERLYSRDPSTIQLGSSGLT
jgi:hypothetical protein